MIMLIARASFFFFFKVMCTHCNICLPTGSILREAAIEISLLLPQCVLGVSSFLARFCTELKPGERGRKQRHCVLLVRMSIDRVHLVSVISKSWQYTID